MHETLIASQRMHGGAARVQNFQDVLRPASTLVVIGWAGRSHAGSQAKTRAKSSVLRVSLAKPRSTSVQLLQPPPYALLIDQFRKGRCMSRANQLSLPPSLFPIGKLFTRRWNGPDPLIIPLILVKFSVGLIS
jgi:hypothetical protein